MSAFREVRRPAKNNGSICFRAKSKDETCIMRHILYNTFFWVLGAISITACQSSNQTNTEEKGTSTTNSTTSPFVKTTLKYARNFKVKYFDHYKVLTITKAFTDQTDSLQYVLVQRGHKAPPGFSKEQVIPIPIRSLVTLSTPHVALAQEIEVIESITGNANNKMVISTQLGNRIKQGKVAEVGNSRNFNKELVLSIAPDVVLMSGTGMAGYKKQQAMITGNTRLIVNTGWLEQHPLARTEWLKFLALFYNKEKLAQQKFDAIEARYLEVKKLAAKAVKKPTVLCGLPFKGTWYVPKGGSYMAQFLRDAKTSYFWNNTQGSGSHPYDFETVFAKNHAADFWINVSMAKTQEEMLGKDPRFAKFAAFRQNQVYNNNKRLNKYNGNDYWVTGFVSPHIVLSDLVKIFHPELLPAHELVYYKRVVSQKSG